MLIEQEIILTMAESKNWLSKIFKQPKYLKGKNVIW